MITVEEAKQIIETNTKPLTGIYLPANHVSGLILAEDITCPIDLPPFDQSAMDGYAFCFKDCDLSKPLNVSGEVSAGITLEGNVIKQSTVRIFTGAALPAGTDTVIMQEKTKKEEHSVLFDDPLLKKGANVRLKGSHTKKNDQALSSKTLLTPAAIGFIASMGITAVKVFPKPKVSIVVTGNELITPGQSLTAGTIYESNSWCIGAALLPFGIQPSIVHCKDTEEEIILAMKTSLEQSDLVLITGGISVGDYDFVLPALNNIGASVLFHKVKQKPGKPLCFATKNDTPIFALPGNPASVLTCFYEYVVPCIRQMMQVQRVENVLFLPLTNQYKKKPGLTHFLKGKISNQTVSILEGQESYRMDTFSFANCLIQLNEEQEEIKVGEKVEVHPLPGLLP